MLVASAAQGKSMSPYKRRDRRVMVKRSEESLVKLATLLIGILGLTALASSLAWGQGFSAEISGVVHDASGAVIPGVSVTAKHIESGLTRTVNTSETGN